MASTADASSPAAVRPIFLVTPLQRDRMESPSPSPPQPSYPTLPILQNGRMILRPAPPPPARRKVLLPLVLFALTCGSTFLAGVLMTPALLPRSETLLESVVGALVVGWQDGLIYMAAVMSILLAHEMGHFLMALRHRIPASFPMFIPLPLPPLGTMGAVIVMRGHLADRRQLFDIGLAGPLAGLLIAVPVAWMGLQQAEVVRYATPAMIQFHDPLIIKLLAAYLRPGVDTATLERNPLLMASWVGFFITGLNMLPISQLDGGHVIYGLLGRRSRYVARAVVLAAIAFMLFTQTYNWILMLSIVFLIGIDHPPTRGEHLPPELRNDRLGGFRTALGIASLSIPILCFSPFAITAEM